MAGLFAIKNELDNLCNKIDLGKLVNRAAANLPQTTAHALFTITTGRILLTHLTGKVTTVIETAANNMKLTYNPTGTGASTDLCIVLDISALAVGVYFNLPAARGSALASAPFLADFGTQMLILGPGTIDLSCDASKTGAIAWMAGWIPLDAGARLVAS